MKTRTVEILLYAGLVVAWISSLGLLVMQDFFERGGIGSGIGAVALALFALFRHRLRIRRTFPGRSVGLGAIQMLRRLHSGHIGDYVAWLTAGMAIIGALLAALNKS